MRATRRGTTSASVSSLRSAVAVLACSTACGGGLPLLHPARTLDAGEIRAAAGFSASVTAGALAGALRSAEDEALVASNPPAGTPAPTGRPLADETYARGALVAASLAPGLAPWVSGRVGFGAHAEGGLTYTTRALRADVRQSFDLTEHVALSVGAGATAALVGHQDSSALPNVDLGKLHGWGADVPLLIGYTSDADLYSLWLGGRAGWEHIDIDDVGTDFSAGPPGGRSALTLSVTRIWGGGLVGVAAGFRHVHVALELDICRASVTGNYGSTHAEVAGWALAPATALWWSF